MSVRVLIVDPQPFFCRSLSAALDDDSDVDVVGWATDEREAAARANEHAPDVVLTELGLDRGSGLALARRVTNGSRVVVLTRGPEGDVLLDAVAAGAVGCLTHDLGITDLRRLVIEASEGGFVVGPGRLHEVLKRASEVVGQMGKPAPISSLTSREREVLRLLAQGLDNRGIARALHMSGHTARTHVGNILRKLGVHSRADAARVILRHERREDDGVLRIRGPELGPR